MPEPGMGSRGSRSGAGMGGGGGYAGPQLDWGMGPEGSEGTEVGGSRPGEDRDFDDVSPLSKKAAFMAKPVSKPVAKAPVVTPVSNVSHYLEDTTPTQIAKTDIEAKKHASSIEELVSMRPSVEKQVASATRNPFSAFSGPVTKQAAPTTGTSPLSFEELEALYSTSGDVEKAIFGKGFGPLSYNKDMMTSFRDRNRFYKQRKVGSYAEKFMGGGPQAINEAAAASVPMGPHRRAPMGNVAGDPSSYQYRPRTKDEQNRAKQAALLEDLPDWARNWGSLWDIAKNIRPNFSQAGWAKTGTSLAQKLGLGDEVVGRRISTRAQLEAMRRLESRRPAFEKALKEKFDEMRPLSEELSGLTHMRLNHPDKKAIFDYAANPRSLGPGSEGIETHGQWDPEGTLGWEYLRTDPERQKELQEKLGPMRRQAFQLKNAEHTFYDLMRHGFLNEQASLPVSQAIELLDSGGQPSDFYNNMLASKFMRGNPAGTGLISSALSARLLDKSPYSPPAFDKQQHDRLSAILAQAGISPMSPSSRISSSMGAWDKLVNQEIMNPGTTGYDFNTNVTDEGVWRDSEGNPRSIMEMINFLRNADWVGERKSWEIPQEQNPGG